MTTQDDRPRMNLGHMALPKESIGASWLQRQSDDREKALKVVEKVAREWLGGDTSSYLPDIYFEMFADRVVTALDQHL